MVRVRVNDMERNSGISFDGDRQVEFTIISQFEKSEAFVTLEELIRKEPDVHSVDLRFFCIRISCEIFKFGDSNDFSEKARCSLPILTNKR
jgi:hypothetical protein